MVAVRMVLVLDTADTIVARRVADGFKSPRVCTDNAAFSGSAHMMPPGSRARSHDRNVSPSAVLDARTGIIEGLGCFCHLL